MKTNNYLALTFKPIYVLTALLLLSVILLGGTLYTQSKKIKELEIIISSQGRSIQEADESIESLNSDFEDQINKLQNDIDNLEDISHSHDYDY